MSPTATFLVLIVSLAVSFLLSGMESGVLALSRLRVRHLARRGNKRAGLLHGFLEKPEDFFWTILVGNTLANFVAVVLVVYVLHGWAEKNPWLFLLGFLPGVFVFYAVCDLLPKILFRQFPNRLCLALAAPFEMIHLVLSPMVRLTTLVASGLSRWTGEKVFTGHLFANREELRLIMQESTQLLTSMERIMISRVLDLQNLTVGHITKPLAMAVTVTTKAPMGEVLSLCREKNLTRLPVWRVDGTEKRIIGIVSLKTQLYTSPVDPALPVAGYLKPALYLDESLLLEEALRQMQRSGQRMAIVLDPKRREVGIVCLQDILKVIFGEVSL
jgi:CBS domain containing-hemolysin-like protein